jgi:quercetin dioxygenase-like cupin family protein
MKIVKVTVAVVALTGIAGGQSRAMDMVPNPDTLKWTAVPPVLPKGAQIAVLSGDPMKEGHFVLRLKMPSNYVIPAHHHPTTENVTVLTGTIYAGMGDKVDKTKAAAFLPGGFVSLPANMNHYAYAGSDSIIQVDGEGPFAFDYVNPADDPSKAR